MSAAVIEARDLVHMIAGPSGSSKVRIYRAKMRLREFSYNRVKDLFYGDRRCRVDAIEMDRLREIARVAKAEIEERAALHEFRELRQRIAVLEARLLSQDEDFFCADADALRKSVGRGR